MPNHFVRVSKCTKIVSIILLAFSIVLDLFFDSDFMIKSADWSASLQANGGRGLEIYGNIFSLFFAFVPVIFEYYIILCSKNKLRGLYHFTTFMVPVTVGGFLKAFYYKGRPYVKHLLGRLNRLREIKMLWVLIVLQSVAVVIGGFFSVSTWMRAGDSARAVSAVTANMASVSVQMSNITATMAKMSRDAVQVAPLIRAPDVVPQSEAAPSDVPDMRKAENSLIKN